MAPEYGATMGFFPIDAECVNYLRATGRSEEQCRTYENYYRAQGLFGIPKKGEIEYSSLLELDLGTVVPSVAGPKRPQDRIELPNLKKEFAAVFAKPLDGKRIRQEQRGLGQELRGGGRSWSRLRAAAARNLCHAKPRWPGIQTPLPSWRWPTTARRLTRLAARATVPDGHLRHGSVVIAAITSCTNTSNPSVMLAAGLLAKKAVERGLRLNPLVKASLAPGSRVVSDYLSKTGLQKYLDELGFNLVGYGCTTCIGNSGPLPAPVEDAITKNDVVAASVLSGNRNFEARIHQNIKANFLMSPPLVVAFALAGRVDIDLAHDPIGWAKMGAMCICGTFGRA